MTSLFVVVALGMMGLQWRPTAAASTSTAPVMAGGNGNGNVENGGCYIVTIFSLKTADCSKHNAKTVPRTFDPDLQVLRAIL
jgi:hypothetical protein